MHRDRNIPSEEFVEGSIDREKGYDLPQGACGEYKRGWRSKDETLAEKREAFFASQPSKSRN